MRRSFFAASVSLVALLVSMPVHAQKPVIAGDDSARIYQLGGTNNLASQHQPGLSSNSAEIRQWWSNANSTAIQEQARNIDGSDHAVRGYQFIEQYANQSSIATQQDNSFDAKQSAVQGFNSANGSAVTSLAQSINTPSGYSNTQNSAQYSNKGSTVSQTIGAEAPGAFNVFGNVQTAVQTGQNLSAITQLISGQSSHNSQSSTQNGSGIRNTQKEAITGSSNFNTMTQTQDAASSFNAQTASINNGSNNLTSQYQGMGSGFNVQKISVDASNSGRALQFQGANVSDGSQTITQTGGGFSNQAGQAQGNSSNYASIVQMGGSGNQAVQNQGVSSGQTGFMSISGGHVTQH